MTPSATTGDLVIPADPRAPIRFELEEHALKLALVHRDDLLFLNQQEWNVPGVYVLIGPQSGKEGHRTKVYIGKAHGADGLRKRLSTQKNKPNAGSDFPWWKVLAFARSTVDGFNGSQVGYLEGRLAAELKKMKTLKVSSGKDDTDETLKPAQLASLDALLPSFMAGLRLAGLQLSDNEEQEDESSVTTTVGKKKRQFKVSIAQLVESGDLTPGDEFTFQRKKESRTAVVTGNGTLLVNDTEYKAPSTAAVAAFDGKISAARGWTVWKRSQGGDSLHKIRKAYLDRLLKDSGKT